MKDGAINKKLIARIYYYLTKIRKTEEKIIELYPVQEIRCPVHLCIGQEAIAAGVCLNLKKTDYLFSNHRNHGHLIAKGVSLAPIFAELYGKKTGCSSGKGGSMHMFDRGHSVMGTSAIVAGGIPIAVGTALAAKMQNKKRVTAVFFGDGAVDEGTFYESLNFASLKKLPILFVCENNFYATNSPQKIRQANTDIYKIARFFLMSGYRVDGNDVLKVYKIAKKTVRRARAGLGPSIIEARTYRCRTHVGPETDIEKGFRTRAEAEEWFARCPHKNFKLYMLKNNLLKETVIKKIEKKVDLEIERALDSARRAPQPDKEDLYSNVY